MLNIASHYPFLHVHDLFWYLISQGASSSHGTFSDYMVHVKLVDGNGEVRDFSASSPEMAAIRACLGMCGIIVEVTLKVIVVRQYMQ